MTAVRNTRQLLQDATWAATTENVTSVQQVTSNVLIRPSKSAKTVHGLTSPYAMTPPSVVTTDAHVPKEPHDATTKVMSSNVRKPPFQERAIKNIPRGSSNPLVATPLCAKIQMVPPLAYAATIPHDAPPMASASKSAIMAHG